MKKNKGFTLVELLAVIAILAIIVVIAYPMITGVIESSRKKTLITSAEAVIHAAELDIAQEKLAIPATTATYSCVGGTNFEVEAQSDPWGNAINVCSVIVNSDGEVTTVSYGSNLTGSTYVDATTVANLNVDSATFTAGSN